MPFTEKPGFSKSELSARLGSRYVHVEELGNASYLDSAIEIKDLEAGLDALEHLARERAPENLLFLCGCKDWRRCHLAVAAVKRLGVSEPQHLDPPHARVQMSLDL